MHIRQNTKYGPGQYIIWRRRTAAKMIKIRRYRYTIEHARQNLPVFTLYVALVCIDIILCYLECTFVYYAKVRAAERLLQNVK